MYMLSISFQYENPDYKYFDTIELVKAYLRDNYSSFYEYELFLTPEYIEIPELRGVFETQTTT